MLWVILGVLVVALIVGGAVLLTSGGDDDDDTATRDRSTTTSTTEPDDDISVPTLPDDPVDTGSGGDAVSQLADNIYLATPAGLDEEESRCIADRIVSVVGADMVAEAGFDYEDLYGLTSSAQDDEIATGIYPCTDVSDDEALAEDSRWPTAWVPRSG